MRYLGSPIKRDNLGPKLRQIENQRPYLFDGCAHLRDLIGGMLAAGFCSVVLTSASLASERIREITRSSTRIAARNSSVFVTGINVGMRDKNGPGS